MTLGRLAKQQYAIFLFLGIIAAICQPADARSVYELRPADPGAYYLEPSAGGDDTSAIQSAIDAVQEKTGQGIVFLASGRYVLRDTIHIWPGIRLIGYGPLRPTMILPSATPGFAGAEEKILLFFAGRRPDGPAEPVPDATPGTFYSAMSNIDVEIMDGNPGAVVVRARYAQHSFLAHIDMHLGPALAGIHEGGNVVEDVRFFGGRHAIWTSRPSAGWQLTVIDSWFDGQRDAAILEREAGLTLIRPHFHHVPNAVTVEQDGIDELWVSDARLEDISGPAFSFGMERNPRTQINMERIACHDVPVFAEQRDSARRYVSPAKDYIVRRFSHGLRYADVAALPATRTIFDAAAGFLNDVDTDIAQLPSSQDWVNVRELGAAGDGVTDDTDVLKAAIALHRVLYFPSGFYRVRDTLSLRADSVLIGLHSGTTQILLSDGTFAYQGVGSPKALLETPSGGNNIVSGIGIYTGGNNPRAVAALWKSGTTSLMNDVRFLGGHGTPLPGGSRENPYNANHTGDPNPLRRWDSQYPSLWVKGGGTFLDIWTPSTFAQAGMRVSDTETEGRVYQLSSEHHVRNEIQLHNVTHWRFYALQTEEEYGESGHALPIDVSASRDILFANLHCYRVIGSVEPFPWAVNLADSRDIRFRNMHCDSNSKVGFDATVFDEDHGVQLRAREFSWLDFTGRPPQKRRARVSPVVETGKPIRKLAGGFASISGSAAGPKGELYFVDVPLQKIYRWAGKLTCIDDAPVEPTNLIVDHGGNVIVVSRAGNGTVYALSSDHSMRVLEVQVLPGLAGKNFGLPISDWHVDREILAKPAGYFVSPDETVSLPVGADFLEGRARWHVKSSPQLRAFQLGRARPGTIFYLSDESELRTWAAEVGADGGLSEFRLFAEEGGEATAVDERGNVYIAAGEIFVYDRAGRLLDTIDVPERPTGLVFGGADGRTLFIPARTSLYALRMRYRGSDLTSP